MDYTIIKIECTGNTLEKVLGKPGDRKPSLSKIFPKAKNLKKLPKIANADRKDRLCHLAIHMTDQDNGKRHDIEHISAMGRQDYETLLPVEKEFVDTYIDNLINFGVGQLMENEIDINRCEVMSYTDQCLVIKDATIELAYILSDLHPLETFKVTFINVHEGMKGINTYRAVIEELQGGSSMEVTRVINANNMDRNDPLFGVLKDIGITIDHVVELTPQSLRSVGSISQLSDVELDNKLLKTIKKLKGSPIVSLSYRKGNEQLAIVPLAYGFRFQKSDGCSYDAKTKTLTVGELLKFKIDEAAIIEVMSNVNADVSEMTLSLHNLLRFSNNMGHKILTVAVPVASFIYNYQRLYGYMSDGMLNRRELRTALERMCNMYGIEVAPTDLELNKIEDMMDGLISYNDIFNAKSLKKLTSIPAIIGRHHGRFGRIDGTSMLHSIISLVRYKDAINYDGFNLVYKEPITGQSYEFKIDINEINENR